MLEKLFFCCFCVYYFLNIIILPINAQKYDPCGYVGSSNDPGIIDTCLTTSTDCCYVTWIFSGYMYYSCVSKTKVIASSGMKNISAGYSHAILNVVVYNNVTRAIYSQCNNTAGAVTSPEYTIPSNPYVVRSLSDYVLDWDDNNKESGFGIVDYFKYLVNKVVYFLV